MHETAITARLSTLHPGRRRRSGGPCPTPRKRQLLLGRAEQRKTPTPLKPRRIPLLRPRMQPKRVSSHQIEGAPRPNSLATARILGPRLRYASVCGRKCAPSRPPRRKERSRSGRRRWRSMVQTPSMAVPWVRLLRLHRARLASPGCSGLSKRLKAGHQAPSSCLGCSSQPPPLHHD